MDFSRDTSGKESTCQCRTHKRHGLEIFPGVENGTLVQYSCLENYMGRGTWQSMGLATVHGTSKESDTTECAHMHACAHTHTHF